MIYIITGDEEFLIKEKSKELIDNLNQESQLNVDQGTQDKYQGFLNLYQQNEEILQDVKLH